MKARSAFTLVELMVVVVIIGILAALAIPRFLGATNKAKAAEFKPVLKELYTLQMAYFHEKDIFSDDVDGSDIGFVQPQTSKMRFTYAAARPASNDPGAANAVGLGQPNSLGLLIKYDGTNVLQATDHACIDSKGQLFADDHLSMISGSDLGDCP